MQKIDEIIRILEKHRLDALFVSSVENIRYLTGFTGDSSRLLITKTGTYLITDGRYTEQAELECFKGIQIFNWIEDQRFQAPTYQYLCSKEKVKFLAFESAHLLHVEHAELCQIKDTVVTGKIGLVEQLRLIKSKDEINALKRAAEISDESLSKIVSLIKPGVSELDVTAELEYAMKKSGADDLSFETMVLFGERSSLLHGKPGSTKLKSGDIILFDFGALYNGYHADISRVFVCEKASPEQIKIHDIVNNAGLNAQNAIKDNTSAKEIDRIVRASIPQDYQQYFYPGIGHGTGLNIHEAPFIKYDSEAILKKDMVVTIEPGLYIPGFGGMRVEDSVLVCEDGSESLNRFERGLTIV
ncbi:M24 family metallopeptidase [Plebeiibacterium sediminum]|uniref:Xaa-Pro peptidase family protein n=1 Tax=Plebeiibacterium sediminum TaxID=2992112 RepID=A0AAE3M3A7_9BACT|nr:Xaa-Pro peptidase family protein [Plebeiobacterium sediminum]MCW3786308.1 Xaa-Pro peptidase family protein [Plebeiobacterium sediminum]